MQFDIRGQASSSASAPIRMVFQIEWNEVYLEVAPDADDAPHVREILHTLR